MAKKDRAEVVIAAVDKVSAPIKRINSSFESMLRPIKRITRAASGLGRELHLKRALSGVKSLGRGLRNLGIAGAAGLGAVFFGVKKLAERGDEIAKLTRRLGLSVEAFQELEFAADRQGITMSVFRRSVQALANRTALLGIEQGTLFMLMKDIDPAFVKAMKSAKNTDHALKILLDRIARLKHPMQQAALATAAFGRVGQPMIQLADTLGRSLQSLRDKAQELGLVMSDKTAFAAERVIDEFTNFEGALLGVGIAVADTLFPALENLLIQMTAFLTKNRETLALDINTFLVEFGTGLKALIKWFRKVLPPVWEFIKSIGGLKTVFMLVGGAILAFIITPIVGLIGLLGGPAVIGIAAAFFLLVKVGHKIAENWEPLVLIFHGIVGYFKELIAMPVANFLSKIPDFFSSASGLEVTTALGAAGAAPAMPPGTMFPAPQPLTGRIAVEATGGAQVSAEFDGGVEADVTDTMPTE